MMSNPPRILRHSTQRGGKSFFESLERRRLFASPYHLSYDDEFNSLNLSSYDSKGNLSTSGYLSRDGYDTSGYDGTTGGPLEYYANPATDSYNPFSTNNGILSIQAEPTPTDSHGNNTVSTNAPYVSGELTTGQGESYTPYNMSNGFSQKYGYFEMRCQVPSGPGMWPAFWLYTEPKLNKTNYTAEYDIFEIPQNSDPSLNENSRTIYETSHKNSTSTETSYTLPAGQDAATAFHTYGFEWDSKKINWYVDGVLTATMPNVSNTPMYVLMNLAVGGSWPGSPNPTTVFPADFKIDYLRIYSNIGGVAQVTPQSGYSVDADTLDAITVAPEPATGGAVLIGLLCISGRRSDASRRKQNRQTNDSPGEIPAY